MTKKIMYGIAIIVLIIAGVFVGKKIMKKEMKIETSANTINQINNIVENNVIENTIEEITEEETAEEETHKKESTAQTPEEIAIEIVKDNWGEDDTVSFQCEEREKDGEYKREISSCC